MRGDVISYQEMCGQEQMSLQRGMNFLRSRPYSVILASIRENAPYDDEIIDDGAVLIYEGHDVPRSPSNPNPKIVDQEARLPSGRPTENGKFFTAATNPAMEERRLVRVYEKNAQRHLD